MAFTTEFVMGAGGTAWDEAMTFSEVGVARNAERTLGRISQPGTPVVVIVVVNHDPGGHGPGSVLVGSQVLTIPPGTSYVGGLISAATDIKVRGGSLSSSMDSSFSGAVYTLPPPS